MSPTPTLFVASQNYSSWSLRAYLAMVQTGAPFNMRVIRLKDAAGAHELARVSPSGRLPVLEVDGLTIWDSLAIGEYLAERYPQAGLWPTDVRARAVARSVVAEMHSGFLPLRHFYPMNIRRTGLALAPTPEVAKDVSRIIELWSLCRERFGAGGPFLFGSFCLADAFYAPVINRFVGYGVALDEASRRYADAVLAWPAMQQWTQAARAEPWVIADYER